MERGESSRDHSRHNPGPAGVRQAILVRRALGLSPPSNWVTNSKSVLEEPTEDDTFLKNPWLKVINYGYLDLEEWNPIATLIPRNGPSQSALVVGILESLTHCDGDGIHNDVYLCVIKDHTGKIDGNINYKIFESEKWQGKIIAGVALILTSVEIWRPTFLNITINNL